MAKYTFNTFQLEDKSRRRIEICHDYLDIPIPFNRTMRQETRHGMSVRGVYPVCNRSQAMRIACLISKFNIYLSVYFLEASLKGVTSFSPPVYISVYQISAHLSCNSKWFNNILKVPFPLQKCHINYQISDILMELSLHLFIRPSAHISCNSIVKQRSDLSLSFPSSPQVLREPDGVSERTQLPLLHSIRV